MTDVLLLDYNGVIVDDEPLHCEAFLTVLEEEGIVLDRDEYYDDYLGLDDRACFRQALDRDGRPIVQGDVGHLTVRKGRHYLTLAARGLPLVPGAAAFVRAAAETTRVAIVSGASRAEMALGLRQTGLDAVVRTVVSCEDVRTSKPDPAGFRLALRGLVGDAPGPVRVVVAEDSIPGLAAALTLGAGCLMLTTSHPASALTGADLVWASFAGHHPDELSPAYREIRLG